jgi:hypothetical protein
MKKFILLLGVAGALSGQTFIQISDPLDRRGNNAALGLLRTEGKRLNAGPSPRPDRARPPLRSGSAKMSCHSETPATIRMPAFALSGLGDRLRENSQPEGESWTQRFPPEQTERAFAAEGVSRQ